jgi:hypothetical protein
MIKLSYFESHQHALRTVTVDGLTGVYVTGKKCAANFLETMRILFDDFLPRWNYRAVPQAN